MFVLLAALLAAAPPPQSETEAHLQAGRSALAARNYVAARQEFTAALRLDSGNTTAHLHLGIIALVEGDAATGLRHFSAVRGDIRAMIGRMDCELRLKRMEEARQTARQLDTLTAGNPAASTHIGTLLAGSGEYATALPFLRRATGPVAANLLGTAEEKSGNLQAAVVAYGEAVRLDSGNEDFRVDHAATLLNAGNVNGSVAAFQAAVEAFPQSARLRLGLGSALYVSGQYDQAVTSLLEAIRLERSPRAFDLLGKAYESAGAKQETIRTEFEKYLATEPPDATAYVHYASFTRDRAQARKALTRALELNSRLAAAYLQLGIMDYEDGDTASAAMRYARAAELDPTNEKVYYRLSVAYRKLGQVEKARIALKEYQRLKGGSGL